MCVCACIYIYTHTHILAGTGSGASAPLTRPPSPLLDNPVSLPQGPLQREFENPALVHISLSLTFMKLRLERPQSCFKHPKARAQSSPIYKLALRDFKCMHSKMIARPHVVHNTGNNCSAPPEFSDLLQIAQVASCWPGELFIVLLLLPGSPAAFSLFTETPALLGQN